MALWRGCEMGPRTVLEPQSYVQPQRYYPSHKDKVVLSLKLGGAVRGSLECPNYEPQAFRLLSLLAYKNT